MKAIKGGSGRDSEAVHFSHYPMLGFGCERTAAIYYPSTNVLEVFPGEHSLLPKVLKALRRYRAENPLIAGSAGPVSVEYW